MNAVLVALAGGLGAVCRFLLDSWVTRWVGRRAQAPAFPLGTVVINVTGSLLLGLVVGWDLYHGGPEEWRAVLGVGLLGGYTTFSTASVETARLLRAGRGAAAALHAAGMLTLSLAAAAAGLWITGP